MFDFCYRFCMHNLNTNDPSQVGFVIKIPYTTNQKYRKTNSIEDILRKIIRLRDKFYETIPYGNHIYMIRLSIKLYVSTVKPCTRHKSPTPVVLVPVRKHFLTQKRDLNLRNRCYANSKNDVISPNCLVWFTSIFFGARH